MVESTRVTEFEPGKVLLEENPFVKGLKIAKVAGFESRTVNSDSSQTFAGVYKSVTGVKPINDTIPESFLMSNRVVRVDGIMRVANRRYAARDITNLRSSL